MRRRLSVLVAATTSAVILAFLIPLVLLVHRLAEDTAVAAANAVSQQIVSTLPNTLDDPEIVRQTLADARATNDTRGMTLTVVMIDGTLIGAPVSSEPGIVTAQRGRAVTEAVGSSKVIYTPALTDQGNAVVRVAVSEARQHRGFVEASAIIVVLGLALLGAAVLAADRLARRVSAPIMDVAATAEALREGHLDKRALEDGPAEVVALARALNRLAERIAQLLAAERDAVADLSHRLRTPVTALRLDAESVPDPEISERLRTHVEHLQRTVDAIVHDARRPVMAAVTASCDVGKVVSERVAFWSALADDQGRSLHVAVPHRPARARLDAGDLTDVVDVLIDNCFAHTEEGTPVEVWVAPRADGAVVLTVEDAGPGLPDGDVVRRGRSGAGSSGLGLDIVRRAALASGGSLELGRSRLGGALVRLVLGGADS